MEKYDHGDVEEIRNVLVGRRIVDAEVVSGYENLPKEVADQVFISDQIGVLTLDNGVQLFIEANVGCGGCTSGWYEVKDVATTNNAITGVRIEYADKGGYETVYRLFVFSENEQVNAVEVEGSDGNGYYGTGFDVYVLPMVIDDSVAEDESKPKALEWKSIES